MNELAAGRAGGFWRSPRGKLLLGLTGVTVLAVLITVFAILRDLRLTSAHFTPEPIFQNLQVKLADAATITIVSKAGRVELVRAGADPKQQHWVVPAAHNYPANTDRVHQLLWGLADLEAIEKKTARADWLAALSLDDPATGGGAIAVTVKDSKNNPLAGLLVGKLKPGGTNTKPMVYVRRAGENQTYLAQGDLPLGAAQKDWLDDAIVDLARDRVERVALTPDKGPAYAVMRQSKTDTDFTIDGLPKGRQMLSTTAANPVGAAAAELTLDDVRPANEVDFSKASHIRFQTFDGLTVRFDLADKGETPWIRVAAQGTTDATTKEAQKILARTGGWAYAIPSWKATLLRKPLEQLLKSPESPKKKIPAAP